MPYVNATESLEVTISTAERIACSADGNVVIVGQPSANKATILEYNGSTWVVAPRGTLSSGIAAPRFGEAVAITANGRFAVVTSREMKKGVVAVFDRHAGWARIARKSHSPGGVYGWGYSVAVNRDASVIVVGQYTNSGAGGCAWVFRRGAGNHWNPAEKLEPAIPATYGDQFAALDAVAVSADGAVVAIGAPEDRSHPTDKNVALKSAGAVYVFRFNAGWKEEAILKVRATHQGALGDQVRINRNGTRIAAWSPMGSAGLVYSGTVYVWEYRSSDWGQSGGWGPRRFENQTLVPPALDNQDAGDGKFSADHDLRWIVQGMANEASKPTSTPTDNDQVGTGAVAVFSDYGLQFHTRWHRLKRAGSLARDQFGRGAMAVDENGRVMTLGGNGFLVHLTHPVLPEPVALEAPSNALRGEMAAANGPSAFAATWTTDSGGTQIGAQILNYNGAVMARIPAGNLDPKGGSGDGPAVAAIGSKFVFAWRRVGNPVELWARTIPTTGPAGTEFRLHPNVVAVRDNVVVASHGAGAAFGFTKATNNGVAIMGSREADLTSPKRAPVQLGITAWPIPSAGRPVIISVAADRTALLWQSSAGWSTSALVGALWQTQVLLAGVPAVPAIGAAALGDGTMIVAWIDSTALRWRRYDGSGTPMSAVMQAATSAAAGDSPFVAVSNGRILFGCRRIVGLGTTIQLATYANLGAAPAVENLTATPGEVFGTPTACGAGPAFALCLASLLGADWAARLKLLQ